MRDAVGQASQAQGVAGTAAGNYGAAGQGIAANLVPQLTRQMQNPQGMSQQDIGAQLTAGLAGAGGGNAALTGAAGKMASTTRNPMGFSAALDSAARSRDKAGAGTAERVAANNADVKLHQQSDAEHGLQGLYGMDVGGQLGAQRNQAADIDAEVGANKTGWLQNMNDTIATLTGASRAYKPGGY